MRLFTAIELSDPARHHLADIQARLKRLWDQEPKGRLPPVSWTREGNLHVTLKFLGDVADERAPELCEALARVELRPSALRLHAEALDVFPSRGAIRVIHGRIAGDVERLAALHGAIELECSRLGFPREKRRYRAHVTMGRPRIALRGAWERLEQSTSGCWPGPRFEGHQFSLVQSQLNLRGSIYTTLARFPAAPG